MRDKRRARKAKQARRDLRGTKKRERGEAGDTTLRDAIRGAMRRRHPLSLLSLASLVVELVKPEHERAVNGLMSVRTRETAALAAVVAELLVEEPALQLRCRHEMAERDDHLPRWIGLLPTVEVYRAVRRADVLGDADEIWIGARIGAHELSVGVLIDNTLWCVVDADVAPEPIDKVAEWVAEANPDDIVSEMPLGDARAWIDSMPKTSLFKTDTWPLYRAVVAWIANRMPDGGEPRSPHMYSHAAQKICEEFFASDLAAPFTHDGHRELLDDLLGDSVIHCGGARRVSE